MRRVFSEFAAQMRVRKHFFFLVLVWSMAAMVLFAYATGIKSSVDNAFDSNETGIKEYTFSHSIKDQNIIGPQSLTEREMLNSILTGSDKYDYYSYFDTTAVTVELTNKEELEIVPESAEAADNEKSGFKVRVLFVDKNVIGLNADLIPALSTLFGGERDIDEPFLAVMGANWKKDAVKLNEETGKFDFNMNSKSGESNIKTLTRAIMPTTFLSGGETLKLGGKEILLDNYIIVPLRDASPASSENEKITEQNRRAFWCKIYDIRNSGVIVSKLSANNLQKSIIRSMEDVNLEKGSLADIAEINIKGASKNKIIFRKDINETMNLFTNVAYVALAIMLLLMLLYVFNSINKNQRYEFVAYITGTGKPEFVFISIMQILFWLIVTESVGYAAYFVLCRLTLVDAISVSAFAVPGLLVAAICGILAGIRIACWDAGRSLRRH